MTREEKYLRLLSVMWEIAVDFHEDNPERHLNPRQPYQVAEDCLKELGEMS